MNRRMRMRREEQIAALEREWADSPRWANVKRGYSAEDVVRLRGSVQPEHTLARRGAEKLWRLVNGAARKGYVNAFGAITAGQAMQQAKAGLEAVYLSGWQVAADGNSSKTMYPDQSLYAYDSVPTMVRRINNTFKRADEIQWSRGIGPGDAEYIDYFLPIVADAEAGHRVTLAVPKMRVSLASFLTERSSSTTPASSSKNFATTGVPRAAGRSARPNPAEHIIDAELDERQKAHAGAATSTGANAE